MAVQDGILIPTSLVTLSSPKDTDNKPIFHTTPRPLGLFTYYTSTGDNQDDPTAVGGDVEDSNVMCFCMNSGISTMSKYLDLNTIYNTTLISQGIAQWTSAVHDEIKLEIIPRQTSFVPSTNTYYNLYGGYLIVPAAGDGHIDITETPNLVQNVPNEFGIRPAGFWDATFNPNTKQFENITAAPYGTGEFNMFGEIGMDIVLFRFGNKIRLLGDGTLVLPSHDSQRVGHGMRFKITCTTFEDPHSWRASMCFIMHRAITC
jgi:hypothetical protein